LASCRRKLHGQDRRLGRITKAGNAQARWILIEAVTAPRPNPEGLGAAGRRQEGQRKVYRRIAWKTQVRCTNATGI